MSRSRPGPAGTDGCRCLPRRGRAPPGHSNLHGGAAHASGGSGDEHGFARLQPPPIQQSRQCTVVESHMMKRWRIVAGSAVVGAALLVSGTALADIPDAGVFHACVRDNKHDADLERMLRIIDTDAGGVCHRDEKLVSWNQARPPAARAAACS